MAATNLIAFGIAARSLIREILPWSFMCGSMSANIMIVATPLTTDDSWLAVTRSAGSR